MVTRLPASTRYLAIGLFLAAGVWCPGVQAGEGFYAAVGLERSFTDVGYEKSFGLASSPSDMTSRDDARASVDALKVMMGYRQPVSSRLYVAGEIEGAFYLDGGTGGFLEGTGEGGADVWPGSWTLERRHVVGLNARFGYIPDSLAFLGAGRSLYLFAGTRWIDTDIEVGHLNRRLDIAGSRREDRTVNAWLAGLGITFGGAGSHFDLRLACATYDIGFGSGGGAGGAPRIGYDFEGRDWSVTLGYVVTFGG